MCKKKSIAKHHNAGLSRTIAPHLKLIESICLKRFNYSEDGHECYVYVLGKLMENNYARINAFQGRKTFKTYLVSITNRLAINFYRHRYGKISKGLEFEQQDPKKNCPRIVPDDQEHLPDAKRLDETVMSKKDRNRLEDIIKSCLSELSQEERLLLKMKYEDDFKVSEIATILKMDPKTTYRKIYTILSRIRETISEDGLMENYYRK